MKARVVTFALDALRYALYLSVVERVVRAVEITPLPKAPEIVVGVINVQGRIIPMVNVRKRFRLPERNVTLNDQFIIAHTSKRAVALVVDTVHGVAEYGEDMLTPAEEIVAGLEYVDGIVRLRDGMVLIHNLESFLSLEEQRSLDRALSRV